MNEKPINSEKIHQWAATIGAIFTSVGVIAALFFSTWSLLEIRRDREFRAKEIETQIKAQEDLEKKSREAESSPLVLFEHEFWNSEVILAEDGSISINYPNETNAAAKSNAPILRNFGKGPALDVKVKWIPKEVATHSGTNPDGFSLQSFEGIAVPSRLQSDMTAFFPFLPNCFANPNAMDIKSVRGDIIVRYETTSRKEKETRFVFTIWHKLNEKELTFRFTRQPRGENWGDKHFL